MFAFEPKIMKRFGLYRRTHGVPRGSPLEFFSNKGVLNLVYTIRELRPFPELLDGSYKFIGPSIRAVQDAEAREAVEIYKTFHPGRPCVYMSLGTGNHDAHRFFSVCIGALRQLGHNGAISCRTRFSVADFEDVPENVVIRPFVPQLRVLRMSDPFISHDGMTLYRRFGYKLEIVRQALEQVWREFEEDLEEASRKTADDRSFAQYIDGLSQAIPRLHSSDIPGLPRERGRVYPEVYDESLAQQRKAGRAFFDTLLREAENRGA